MTEGDDRVTGGVEKMATVMEAENGALDLEHDVAVDVGDGEGALGDGHQLLRHDQVHRVRRAELRPHHRDRIPRRRPAWCRQRHFCADLIKSVGGFVSFFELFFALDQEFGFSCSEFEKC